MQRRVHRCLESLKRLCCLCSSRAGSILQYEALYLLCRHRYKAHFRWRHHPQVQAASDYDLPQETEACASVTSAFLQVTTATQSLTASTKPDCCNRQTRTQRQHKRQVHLHAAGSFNSVCSRECASRSGPQHPGGKNVQLTSRSFIGVALVSNICTLRQQTMLPTTSCSVRSPMVCCAHAVALQQHQTH